MEKNPSIKTNINLLHTKQRVNSKKRFRKAAGLRCVFPPRKYAYRSTWLTNILIKNENCIGELPSLVELCYVNKI